MSHTTIKKLQTFIFIYIIVIDRGGQSLKKLWFTTSFYWPLIIQDLDFNMFTKTYLVICTCMLLTYWMIPRAVVTKMGQPLCLKTVFFKRRSAARYLALASIIPGRERFSWNLSF